MSVSQKQRDKDEQTSRLHNMLVHEVSIVDRPANQRRFLVVKGEEQMSNAAHELVDDGRGGLVAAGKADDDGDKKNVDDKNAAVDDDDDDDAADKKKIAHPDDDDDDDDKDKDKSVDKAGDDDAGGGGGGGGGDDDDDDDDKDKKKPPPFGGKAPPFGGKTDEAKKAISEAAAQVDSLVAAAKASGVELDDETKAKLEDAKKALDAFGGLFATDKSDDDTPPELGSTDAIDMLKAVGADDETIAALNKLLGRKNMSVEKAGARMAKERLERFRKAMELLQTLLKEFLPELKAQAKLEKSATPTTDPLSLLSMFRSPGDAEFVAEFAKRAHASPELVDKINNLTALVQKQNDRVAEISKTSSGSNVIPIERQAIKKVDEHKWPIDMNNPMTRETVDKSVSFFDVE